LKPSAIGRGAALTRTYNRNAGDGPAVSKTKAGGPLPKSYVRLTHPLVRDTKGGELRQATWDEALDRTVLGLQAALAKRASAEAKAPVGIFSCSKSTNEVNFAAQKLSRIVLGSNNIDSCNRT
jgi:formate dehydrogenase major subunit